MRIVKVAQAIDGAVFLDKEECVAYDRMIAAVNSFNKSYGEKWQHPVRLMMAQPLGPSSKYTEMKKFYPKEI